MNKINTFKNNRAAWDSCYPNVKYFRPTGNVSIDFIWFVIKKWRKQSKSWRGIYMDLFILKYTIFNKKETN